MPTTLPSEVTFGKVTGTFVNAVKDTAADEDPHPDKEPAGGTLMFQPNIPKLMAKTSKVLIIPKQITVALDANGYFEVYLIATDNPDIEPQGWDYTVAFDVPGLNMEPFSFGIAGGAEKDITELYIENVVTS